MTHEHRAQLFDDWAEHYDRSIQDDGSFPFDGYEKVLDEIVRAAGAQSGMKVLDLWHFYRVFTPPREQARLTLAGQISLGHAMGKLCGESDETQRSFLSLAADPSRPDRDHRQIR
jgi:hypothetical protein